ncbi:hypothetical protein HY441_01255 [Candidatus Microgenomates bacterium]|nr:hypothetical protein [Candidatus Microgenomates bacterium]
MVRKLLLGYLVVVMVVLPAITLAQDAGTACQERKRSLIKTMNNITELSDRQISFLSTVNKRTTDFVDKHGVALADLSEMTTNIRNQEGLAREQAKRLLTLAKSFKCDQNPKQTIVDFREQNRLTVEAITSLRQLIRQFVASVRAAGQ